MIIYFTQLDAFIISFDLTRNEQYSASSSDLIPRENVEDWLKYLRNEFPTVAFKASTQTQNENLVRNYIVCSDFDIFHFCFLSKKY